MPPAPPKKTPRSPHADKPAAWVVWVKWLFIVGAIAGIAAMVIENPRQKTLVCKNAVRGAGSLSSFGSCTTE